MPSPLKANARQRTRRALRQARRSVDAHQRQSAARQLCAQLVRAPAFAASRRIAAYWPSDGEIDVAPLVVHALATGKQVYLPVIRPGDRLRFARFEPGVALTKNRYGIPEPQHSRSDLIDPRHLDLVLVPLVAFDPQGHRLGMGAGYYDRTFRFLRQRRHWWRPKLLGVAYEFQKVAAIEPQPWDIALWQVLTETASYLPPTRP